MKEISTIRKLIINENDTNNNLSFNMKQLNRITITIDDISDAQSLTSGNEFLKKFDLVAICPGNAKIFSYLCKTAEIDLISIDFSHKVPFPMKKKLVRIICYFNYYIIINSITTTNANYYK